MTTATLPRSTPIATGVDPRGITGFLDAMADKRLELHSLMVCRAGKVVAEGWWKPYGADRPHMQHSLTKSWVAAGIGLAVGEGLLALTDRVIDFFPDQLPEVVSDHLAAMTVEDLLTMRTGHRTGISGVAWRGITTSWVEAFLREPVVSAPGGDFMYSSATSYMLSAIVTKVTGQLLADYMEPRLFRPMGMAPMTWDVSPEGINTGGNGLTCIQENVLKFGLLHLAGGLWEGQQLLPADYVRAATTNRVEHAWIGAIAGGRFVEAAKSDAEKRDGYGYQWWMMPFGGYRASGIFGQQCIVLPHRDAVIVTTAALPNGNRDMVRLIWEHIEPALAGSEGATAADEAALAARLATLAMPAPQGAAHSPTAARIDGRVFVVEDNVDGVTAISLSFTADRCHFRMTDTRGEHGIEAGLAAPVETTTSMSGAVLHHQYESDAMAVVAQGAWMDDNRFEMRWRFVETTFADIVTCTFDGDGLRLDRRVNTNSGALDRPTLIGSLSSAR